MFPIQSFMVLWSFRFAKRCLNIGAGTVSLLLDLGPIGRRAVRAALRAGNSGTPAFKRPHRCPRVERDPNEQGDTRGGSAIDILADRSILDAGPQQDKHRYENVEPER